MGIRQQREPVMPDSNNRYVKQDLQDVLIPAELRIVQYRPPAATITDGNGSNTGARINIAEVQRQAAQKSGQERTDALFNFLVSFITQGASDEIDRRQILQRISNLERRLATLEAGSIRSGSL